MTETAQKRAVLSIERSVVSRSAIDYSVAAANWAS
jgi:hypothetical protein